MPQKELTIRISKEGEVFFMYDDDSLLREFGFIQITRASNIRWDEEEQKWYVWVISPEGTEVKTKVAFEERRDAIQAEIDVLDSMLIAPESKVGNMFGDDKAKVKPAV